MFYRSYKYVRCIMSEHDFITEEHGDNLPTVRIKKVILKDFKSVGYGEITFNCGRQFIPYNTESDILGIYGQNGSGKTSFIEALAILQELMAGATVPSVYADCVAAGKEFSELEFVFDLQYPDGAIREAAYSFRMSSQKLTAEEIRERYKDAPEEFEIPEEECKVVIFDEKFSLLWEDASKRQAIIDTSSEDSPFKPTTKRKEIAGVGKKTLVSLEVNKQLARSNSRSFIFMTDFAVSPGGGCLGILFCLGKSSGIFLHQPAGNHDLMSAPHAFKPEISSHPEDFPLAAAAGMGLFELYYVPYFIIQLFIHAISPFLYMGLAAACHPFSMPSMSASSSQLNAGLSRAFALSSSWAILLAPMRTLVTSFL